MIYQVIIKPSVLKQLRRFDKKAQIKILTAIEALSTNPRPHGYKKLVDSEGLCRIRVGNYRVVYDIADDILIVTVLRTAKRDENTY